MTAILGVSAFFHDSAAALLVDGKLIAAAQEERFSRIKHDASFPAQAARFCLDRGGLSASQLDCVAFYEKPLLKFERLLDTYLSYAPRGLLPFLRAMPPWINEKLHLRRLIRSGVNADASMRTVFCRHHHSHAASAFYPSPFEQAAILTVDGVGEAATTAFGIGRDNRIEMLEEIRFPHSLGLLYSAFTYYCGFRVNSGEYKLMGLAPTGRPEFADTIFKHLIDVKDDGSFRLDTRYFGYCSSMRMTSSRFHRLFGAPPRQPETPIRSIDRDLAASVQLVLETVLSRIVRRILERTGQTNLCIAGGVGLNAVANGKLLRQEGVERIWVQPAAGDAGGALGAAQLIHHQMLDRPRVIDATDSAEKALTGPPITAEASRQCLDTWGADYDSAADEAQLCERVAELLAEGKVVAWAQGRMEFGPRALGNRSILADPRIAGMQALINEKVKRRESFRPFAPAVLIEHASECFDLPAGFESPYMLFVVPARGDRLPATTHVDGSARVQTVDSRRFPLFHKLLSAFYRKTGCPVLINTSFNVRGEPLACTEDDAYRCFLRSEIDVLALDRFILERTRQPQQLRQRFAAEQFALD